MIIIIIGVAAVRKVGEVGEEEVDLIRWIIIIIGIIGEGEVGLEIGLETDLGMETDHGIDRERDQCQGIDLGRKKDRLEEEETVVAVVLVVVANKVNVMKAIRRKEDSIKITQLPLVEIMKITNVEVVIVKGRNRIEVIVGLEVIIDLVLEKRNMRAVIIIIIIVVVRMVVVMVVFSIEKIILATMRILKDIIKNGMEVQVVMIQMKRRNRLMEQIMVVPT